MSMLLFSHVTYRSSIPGRWYNLSSHLEPIRKPHLGFKLLRGPWTALRCIEGERAKVKGQRTRPLHQSDALDFSSAFCPLPTFNVCFARLVHIPLAGFRADRAGFRTGSKQLLATS